LAYVWYGFWSRLIEPSPKFHPIVGAFMQFVGAAVLVNATALPAAPVAGTVAEHDRIQLGEFTVMTAVVLSKVSPHASVIKTQYVVSACSAGVIKLGWPVPTGVDIVPLAPWYH